MQDGKLHWFLFFLLFCFCFCYICCLIFVFWIIDFCWKPFEKLKQNSYILIVSILYLSNLDNNSESCVSNKCFANVIYIFLGTLKRLGVNVLFTDNSNISMTLKVYSQIWDNFGQKERPLKMMKNAFYFALKVLLVMKIWKYFSWLFGYLEKRLG